MSADVVAQVKQELLNAGENLDHQCGAFKITSTVAWRLRAQGWGLIKSEGNGCLVEFPDGTSQNFRVDTLMQKSGSVIDCLSMAETNEGKVYPDVPHDSYNIPVWNGTGPQPPENWYEPYDPGLLVDNGGTNPVPPQPTDPSLDTQKILTAIGESETRVKAHVTAETERVLAKLHELRGEVIEFANKLGRVIVINRLRSDEPEPPTKKK